MKKSLVLLGLFWIVVMSLYSQTGVIFTIDTVSFDMIYADGGEYKMVANMVGSVDGHQKGSDFYIGETEVTQ